MTAESQTGEITPFRAERILDTVVLIAFVDPSHPLHQEGKKYVEALTTDTGIFVPSTSVIELDLVLKGAGFKFRERKEIFDILNQMIPDQKVLPLTSSVMTKAIELDNKARWTSHYFDAIIAAYAFNYSAKILTTDRMLSTLGVDVEW